MQLRALWRRPDDGRLTQFQDALLAAQATCGYRESLRVAGFDSPRAVRRLRSIEEGLRRLPSVPYEHLRARPEDFHNPHEVDCEPQPLPYPPGMVAERLETLLEWAAARDRNGSLRVPHGLVALINFAAGGMPERTRESLWRAFEVPVFEQWIGLNGSVLAAECEAHEGMHVLEDRAVIEQGSENQIVVTSLTDRRVPLVRVATGFTGTLLAEPCACGRPGARLVVVKQAQAEQAIAAYS